MHFQDQSYIMIQSLVRQNGFYRSIINPFPSVNYCKFDENDEKFSKRVENTVGKQEIACHEQFLLFQQFFLPFLTYTVDT